MSLLYGIGGAALILVLVFIAIAVIAIPLRKKSGKRLERGKEEKESQETKGYLPSVKSLRENARPIAYIIAALLVITLIAGAIYVFAVGVTAVKWAALVPAQWPLILMVLALAGALLYFSGSFARVVVAAAIIAVAVLLGIIPAEKLRVDTLPWFGRTPPGMRVIASSCRGVAEEPATIDSRPAKLPDNCHMHLTVTAGVAELIGKDSRTLTVRPGVPVEWPKGFEAIAIQAKVDEAPTATVWTAFCPLKTPKWDNGCKA